MIDLRRSIKPGLHLSEDMALDLESPLVIESLELFQLRCNRLNSLLAMQWNGAREVDGYEIAPIFHLPMRQPPAPKGNRLWLACHVM
jgi:hypothetical protein